MWPMFTNVYSKLQEHQFKTEWNFSFIKPTAECAELVASVATITSLLLRYLHVNMWDATVPALFQRSSEVM